jgi:phage terminase large subunit GpA-like protein
MTPTEPWMLQGRAVLAKAIADALRPDPKISVDEWAEANRILPPDTPEAGPYRNARTPYVIDIQRTMSPGSRYREGWWMKPHQVGGSVTGENLIGSWICTAAGNILVIFPTLDDAKQWELTRFEPMRANTKALRRRILAADKKGSDNTKLRKKFPGGVMRLVGSNRVGALKSSTIRYIKFEEPDEYVRLEQGTVTGLAIARTSNFGRKAKIFGDGTPTFDGRSEIQRQVLRGDQRKWFLHCPDCAHPQPLVWEQLKWVDGDSKTARYACASCGALNDEASWKAGNYRPRAPGMTESQAKAAGHAYWEATAIGQPGVASWCGLEALAAPVGWRPWPDLVDQWLGAQGDDDKLREFVNNIRALPYTDTVRSDIGAEALQQRAEQYDLMTCPAAGLICLAGVDTQDNRLAVVIRAFGRGEESWGIWHGEIYGDTSAPETWAKLRELLDAPIRHASGQVMRVDAAFIDAGGHRGEDVYAFCRDAQLRGKHWCAIRGAKSYDAPKLGRPKTVSFTWRGKPVEGGGELRFLGTQAIKNLIDGRLKLNKPGGGYYHFPLGFQADYYKQMRAEKREWRRDMQGHKALWWVKTTERNEAWDCEVYVYAAYLYAMSGRHAETVWSAREKLYGQTRQLELLDDGATPPASAEAQPAAAAGDPEQPAEATAQDEDTDDSDAPAPASTTPAPAPHPRRGAVPVPPRRRNSFVHGWNRP